MLKQFKNHTLDACFAISRGFPTDFVTNGNYLMFLWNDGLNPLHLNIDDHNTVLHPRHITCTTYLHKVQIDNSDTNLKTLLFNREFYCVHTFDSEVSCNGLLFFGSSIAPRIKLDQKETERLQALYSVLEEEFSVSDTNQEEMLRILLKRFIIRCTRLARKQILKRNDDPLDIDLVRSFNVLVEEHFKVKKTVGEIAALMHKSPKTITNVFSRYSEISPLQVIHNRIMMEAKRMLLYTDKSSKEIGYELGYSDPAQFSKLFKNICGMTTIEFRNSKSKIRGGQN